MLGLFSETVLLGHVCRTVLSDGIYVSIHVNGGQTQGASVCSVSVYVSFLFA